MNDLCGNIVYIVERSILMENPYERQTRQRCCVLSSNGLSDISFNDSCYTKGDCVGTFQQKNVLPLNHWRKTLDFCKDRKPTIVLYKDNMSLNGHKLCKGGSCYRAPRLPNREFISSYSTLHDKRHKSYVSNIKTTRDISNNKQIQYDMRFGVVKFSNPRFNTNGAVSSRNRIAALKNGNLHNNVYKKRCDDRITEQLKRFKVVKKMCKPSHYGGKWKNALLRCPV
jgi:hypothetical protein